MRGKRNPVARALRTLKPKVRQSAKAYRRNAKHPQRRDQ